MPDVKQSTPLKRRLRRLLYLALAVALFATWREHTLQRAKEQVLQAGFKYWERSFSKSVGQNWHSIFRLETWVPELGIEGRYRKVDLVAGMDGLARLGPTHLDLCGNKDLQSVAQIERLSGLRSLDLSDCNRLGNLDALRKFTSLEVLNLSSSGPFENIEPLRNLTSLKILRIARCTALRDMEVLRKLKNLNELNLTFCPAPVNVEVLSGLTKLKTLYLNAETVTPAQLAALKAALPGTKIDPR
jgi:hypothetical protein